MKENNDIFNVDDELKKVRWFQIKMLLCMFLCAFIYVLFLILGAFGVVTVNVVNFNHVLLLAIYCLVSIVLFVFVLNPLRDISNWYYNEKEKNKKIINEGKKNEKK